MASPKHTFTPHERNAWTFSVLAIMAAMLLGLLCRPHITRPAAGCITSGVLLLVLLAGSLAGRFIYARQISGRTAQQARDELDRRRQRMKQHPAKEKRRFSRLCMLIIGYIVLLVVLMLSFCLFCSTKGSWVCYLGMLCLYPLYGLVHRLYSLSSPKKDLSGALCESEYPLLYSLVREAAELDIRTPLTILPGDFLQQEECNAGVTQSDGRLLLTLGPVLLSIATEAEMRQVIRHELAHVHQDHVKERLQYYKLMSYLSGEPDESSFSSAAAFPLLFPGLYLLREGKRYFDLASAMKETQADEQASGAGDPSAQASVMAKMDAYNLYQFERELYLNLFAEKDVPQSMITDLIRDFRFQLKARETDWRRILENEIAGRPNTHPTFRQRWEALGCCTYSLEPACEQGAYALECRAAAEAADRAMASITPERYEQLRKEHYLDPLQAVQPYEADPDQPIDENYRDLIEAYRTLGMPEKAERICDRILSGNSSMGACAFAHYWKGICLLHRYDDRGIDCLYQAMDASRNYTEDALWAILHYCTMMGLKERLEEYRSRVTDYVQEHADAASAGISAEATLTPERLPDGWQEMILSFILKTAGGSISHVYLVHEIVSESYSPSSIVLRYREDASVEERERINTSVFNLLDDCPEPWEFCLYEYEPYMERPLAKVSGSCIYQAES